MTMSCLSGCLVSSDSTQMVFCVICSVFKWSFDEFVGEEVVSLPYSSAILGLPPLPSVFSNRDLSMKLIVDRGFYPLREWEMGSVSSLLITF